MIFTTEIDKSTVVEKLELFLKKAESFKGPHSKRSFESWHNAVVEYLDEYFTDNEVSEYFQSETELRYSQIFYTGMSDEENISSYNQAKSRKALRYICSQTDSIAKTASDANEENAASETYPSPDISEDKVFIVHGHDRTLVLEVLRTVELLGLDPVILSDEPNQGRTIIEKFENASNVGFAIILMTADDIGSSKADFQKDTSSLCDRARQNVILELGYFFAKLGRARICVLKSENVEVPSDILGIVYEGVDPKGYWKFNLARELKAAGYDVDANKIM